MVVESGGTVAVGPAAAGDVLDDPGLPEHTGMTPLQGMFGLRRTGAAAGPVQQFDEVVGGAIVAVLDHRLHPLLVIGRVVKLTLLDLVEERQGDERLDHAGALVGQTGVDGDQETPTGEIVD